MRRALAAVARAAFGPSLGAGAKSRRSGYVAALGPASSVVALCLVVFFLRLAPCLRRSFCHEPHRNSSNHPWDLAVRVPFLDQTVSVDDIPADFESLVWESFSSEVSGHPTGKLIHRFHQLVLHFVPS